MTQTGGEPACFNLPVDGIATAYLGLGTNVGDRAHNLEDALLRISRIVRIEQTSSIYETEPMGFKDQPEFWNLVLQCSTELPAHQLLQEVQAVEAAMGRERNFPDGPRNIDIDVLLFDDVVMAESDLQIPHPRMHERAFVLRPLLEISPEATDPRTGARFADMLAGVPPARAELLGSLPELLFR